MRRVPEQNPPVTQSHVSQIVCITVARRGLAVEGTPSIGEIRQC
jgi:hypothetical protein